MKFVFCLVKYFIMLTKPQTRVLEFIIDYLREHGYAPSYREVAQQLGFSSPATVWQHVNTLRKKGYLRFSSKARSLSPSAKAFRVFKLNPAETIRIPILGMIPAGTPVTVYEYKEHLVIPKTLVSDTHSDLFALEVKGDSMIEEGIYEGDWIICEPAYMAKNGDVVVALVNDSEVTLKKYYKEKGRIRLMPANSKMSPILSRNVQIQGVVKALFRKY